MIAAIYARKSADQIGRTTRENMMGKRTLSEKKLNKEPNGNGSSVDQQILAWGVKRTKLEEMLDEKRQEAASLSPQRDTGRIRQLEREIRYLESMLR
jgi:hypothetical protein